jgi:hypothetical protein
MADDDPLLHAIARRIQLTINETGRCLITQAADLATLKALGIKGLRDFSAPHGWTVVPRLGFTQIEFFTAHLPPVRAGLV